RQAATAPAAPADHLDPVSLVVCLSSIDTTGGSNMRAWARFYGTRGSIPVCDRDFQDFGGNTTCVMIGDDAGQVAILDAGSGIRSLGKDLLASGHRQEGTMF